MSASIIGDLTIELATLKAQLATAKVEIRQFKTAVAHESAGMGHALFGKVGEEGLKELAPALARGLANPAMLIGAAVAGAAVGFKEIVHGYREIEIESRKLGATAEDVQRLGVIARRSGGDVEAMAHALLRLEANQGGEGSEGISKALDHLGLSGAKLMNMNLTEKVLAFGDAVQKARATGSGLADLKELMGKGYEALLPALTMDNAALREALAGAYIATNAEVEAAARLDEQFEQAAISAENVGKKLVIGIVPAMDTIGKFLGNLYKRNGSMKGLMELFTNPFGAISAAGRDTLQQKEFDNDNAKKKKDLEEADSHHKVQDTLDRQALYFAPKMDNERYYGEQLKSALGDALPKGSSDIRGALAKLTADTKAAGAKGDYVKQGDLQDRLSRAQTAAISLDKASGGEMRAPMGSLGGQVNWLLGKSSGEMVSQKIADGNNKLDKIALILTNIERGGKGIGENEPYHPAKYR